LFFGRLFQAGSIAVVGSGGRRPATFPYGDFVVINPCRHSSLAAIFLQ